MAENSEAKKNISMHRVPCGPLSINASGVCRRRLRDTFNTLLDRLSQETGPQQPMGPEVPGGHTMMPDGTIMENSYLQAQEAKKKARKAKKEDPMGRLAEAIKGLSNPQQSFNDMGNSKMLQDPSGKLEPYKEGKNPQSNKPKQ
jgi:hypothetical protein